MSPPLKRILVVDDTEATRYLVVRLLERHGYEVLQSATGSGAIEVARREQPLIMVLDIRLPDIDGFEVVERIKADPVTRPIVVLHLSASYTASEARAEGLRRGADAYLTHPVDPEVLCATVDAMVRLREAQQREHEARERAERGQAERERLIERLREEDRRKTAFLAMMSHELRNPLGPIRNSVHILEREPLPGERARRAVEVIGRQATQLTRLVDDLLDATRIRSGKLRLRLERVDLARLVPAAIEDLRGSFARRGVQLSVRCVPGPVVVEGDAARLGQIVANLMHNAAKFTDPGGAAELALSVEGGQAVVRVRDTGAGIQQEMLPHLFEPFVQAEGTLDRSRGGLGLGLSLVKGLAELHHGEIAAESEGPGRGAQFTLRLPVVEVAGEAAAPHVGGSHGDGANAARLQAAEQCTTGGTEEAHAVGPSGAEPPPRLAAQMSPAPPPRPRRVLLIEDNEDGAATLKEVLELGGHVVATSSDGPSGIALARRFQPDVVLCDIGLPGMSGYEVATALRGDPSSRDVLLVALSGHALQDDVARSLESGFDHHLPKPPDLRELHRLLALPARPNSQTA